MIINETELIATIRSIPDFPKEGILFRDITTLLKNADAYETLVESIAEKLRPLDVDILKFTKTQFFRGSALQSLTTCLQPAEQQKLLSTLWKKWGQKLLLLILQSNLPISAVPTCSVIIMFTQLSNTDIKDNSRE